MSSDQVAQRQNVKARRKGCGVLLTLALLGFLLLAVPAVIYLFFTLRAAKLVRAELDEIRAAGEPVSAEDLDAYYEYPPLEEDATQLWLAALKPLDGPAYSEACGELPIVGDSDEEKVIPPPGQPWEDLEAAEQFLAQYADSLDLLHQAAKKGGAARFDRKSSDGYEMPLPNVILLRSGARVLALQVHVRAHRGDVHGAAESIHAIFMIGNSLDKDPVMLSLRVRTVVNWIGFELIQELIPHVEFPDDDLAVLRADIQAIDYDQALERATIGQRAVCIMAFKDPALLRDLGISRLMALVPRDEDLLLCLRFMNEHVAATKQPWPQRLDDTQAAKDAYYDFFRTDSSITRFRYQVTRSILPAITAFVTSAAENEALAQAADTALAIEQFSRKNGGLPDKLDELVPEFLDKVPIDPFDGQPLRYVVRKNEYVIYSIGKDRIDNGGQILEEKDEFGDYVQNPDVIFAVKRSSP